MKWRSNISASSSLTLDVFLLEVVGANPGTISTIPVNTPGTFGNMSTKQIDAICSESQHQWGDSDPAPCPFNTTPASDVVRR